MNKESSASVQHGSHLSLAHDISSCHQQSTPLLKFACKNSAVKLKNALNVYRTTIWNYTVKSLFMDYSGGPLLHHSEKPLVSGVWVQHVKQLIGLPHSDENMPFESINNYSVCQSEFNYI